MRKLILLMPLLILLVLIAPSTVLAKQDPIPFNFVTSPTDNFQPEKEYSVTFAKEITLKAETVKGAKVNITVTPVETPEVEPTVYDEITIGATCKLIQPINLTLGDNLVEVNVSKEGFESKKLSYNVRRKDGLILQSLQNMIVIPGGK